MLHLLFWVFILILGLSYFGISLQGILGSPTGQANIAYLYDLLLQVWYWALPYIQPFLTFLSNLKP
jgi:hypothetical protein